MSRQYVLRFGIRLGLLIISYLFSVSEASPSILELSFRNGRDGKIYWLESFLLPRNML